jgi:hypothetical protein
MAEDQGTQGTQGTQGAQTNVSQAWADSLDADTKGWVGGKAWDKLEPTAALAEAIKLGRSAEQKLGVPADQILRLPGKDAKPEEWRSVYARLGAPEKPEDYGITAPEGDPGEFLKTATGWFHELGVPKSMAAGIAGKWNEYVASQKVAADGKWNETFDKEMGELKTAWGADFDKNRDLARRVEKATGLKPEQLTGVERALGPRAYQEFLARFGTTIGEHRFQGSANAGSFSMSAEAAKQRLADLSKDEGWKKKYLSGDADAKAEFTRLTQIANPEQMAA